MINNFLVFFIALFYYFCLILVDRILFKYKVIGQKKLFLVLFFFALSFYLNKYFGLQFYDNLYFIVSFYLVNFTLFKMDSYSNIFVVLVFCSLVTLCKFGFVFMDNFVSDFLCYKHIYLLRHFIVDCFALFLSLLIVYVFKRYICKLWFYLRRKEKGVYYLFGVFYIISLIIAFFLSNYVYLDMEIIDDMIILFLLGLSLVYCFSTLDKRGKMDLLCRNLIIRCDDFRNSVSNYRIINHENKNKLLVIKSMISSNDMGVNDYINEILDENVGLDNSWDGYLQNLTLSKDFINYKLTKMKKLGANIEFYVSDKVSNVNLGIISSKKKNDIYTILGVILDNMIEALESVDLKLVSILIYLDNNKICGEFANSFKGNVGIERIFDKGYTTKGDGHGYGLYVVKEIIKRNSNLELETKVIDDFFVQKLFVDLALLNDSD